MEVLVAQVINGLSIGSMYVLLVTGFNLLLLVAMIIHYSYPQLVVLSMYAAWFVLRLSGNDLVLGSLAAVAASILISLASAPLFQKATRRRTDVDINSTMVMSLGIGLVVTDVLSHGFNNGLPVAFPVSFAGASVFRFGLISISSGQVASLIGGGLAVCGFFLLLSKSSAGRSFRAIAEDPDGARLAGIPLLRTGLQSFALAGLLGGITALFLAALLGYASADLGEQVAQKVLAISIIAGLGNLAGGLVVGLALGIIEALVQGYVSGTWSNAIAFVVMLVVILSRPKGLFGSRL